MNYIDDTPELGAFINPYPKRSSLKNNIKDGARGLIVVIEGLDGSGKSSQLKLLNNRLVKDNKKVFSCNFIHSDFIKPSLLKTKWENANEYTFSCMYTMGLSQTYFENIVEKVNEGYIVLLDRYIFTIYLKAVVSGIPKEWINNLLSFFKKPDLTFFIDVPEETCLSRKINLGKKLSYWECGCNIFGTDDCRFTYDESKMRELFLKYQNSCRKVLLDECTKNDWKRIDGTKEMDSISNDIYNELNKYLSNKEHNNVG